MAGAGEDSLQLSSMRRRAVVARGRVLILSSPLCSAPLTPHVRLRHIAPFPLSTLNPQTGKFIHRHFESRTADRRLTAAAADCTQASGRGWPTERVRTAAAACRRKSDGRGRRLRARMRRSTLTDGDPFQDVTKSANGQTEKQCNRFDQHLQCDISGGIAFCSNNCDSQ